MRTRLVVVAFSLMPALHAFGALTGTVVNGEGQPVAGAKVAVLAPELTEASRTRLLSESPERVPVASATTDAKGRFSIDGLKDPVVGIRVLADGFAASSARAERNEDLGTIGLTTVEMKQGRITNGAGKAVTGATVIWLGEGGELVAKTDEQGRYSVPDPSKWASQVIVRHPDYALLTEAARRNFTATTVATDRTMTTGAPLRGKVVGEDGKTPVANASLFLDGWLAGTSGEDGTFTIARAPGKWTTLTAHSGALRAQRVFGGTGDITLRLVKPITITGVVRETKSQAPVAGASVSLRNLATRFDSFLPSIAITDAKGAFSASGIVPGSYEMMVSQPAYSLATQPVSGAANDKIAKTFAVTQLARVSGNVIDEEKKPLAGVRIAANVSRDPMMMMMGAGIGMAERRVLTAPDGTFVLRAEPDADVQISATRKGYPPARSSTLRLNPGERKSGVVLTIPAGMTLTGRVTDRDGRPLADVAVGAMQSEGLGGGAVNRIILGGPASRTEELLKTERDGTFTIRLKEGTYDMAFRREGFAPKTVRAQKVASRNEPLSITLEPGVEVRGRVVRGSTGIDSVNINIFAEGGPPAFAVTQPDGSFTIGDLAPGTYRLLANKPDEFIQINRSVTAPAIDLVLDVPPGGRVSGRVLDKTTKQPVTTFQIGVVPPRAGGMVMMMGPSQMRVFTSDDGTFTLENVPVGSVQVLAQSAGYTQARLSNINVEEGKIAADLELLMDRGATVKGRVTGPDGSPVAGVGVRAEAADNLNAARMAMVGGRNAAVTDASGDYTIEAIEPGEKTFTFIRSGYVPEQKTVTVAAGEVKVDAQLSSGVRISGVVVTEGGMPVGEASVSASSAAGSSFGRSVPTDANGNFQMEGLAPGRYTFNARKSGLASGQLRDFDIVAGGPVRIVMKTGGTIYGRVSGLSPEELQQATVFATSPSGNASAAVDSSGNYRIEGAPTGTVRVGARTSVGMTGGRNTPQVSVQIEPGSSVQQDIEFKTGTSIRGRITREGRPVPDAMITFFPKNAQAQTSARTTADRDGNYEVAGLDDATYNVGVNDMQRGTPFMTTYEVRGSGTFNIDMKAGSVRGRVVDANTGEPVREASVELRDAEAGMGIAMRGNQTDSAGAFVIDGVAPGKYYLSAEKEGYGSKLVDFTMSDSAPDVEVKLAKNAGVTLKVVDARDGRVLNARVRVTDAQNRVVSENMFRFGQLAEPLKLALDAGTYTATIVADGYATQIVQITSPSSPTIGLTPGGTLIIRSKGGTMRRARLMRPDGREYSRFGAANAAFMIDPAPGTTTLENVAAGVYTLQVLGPGDKVESSAQVSVTEGQRVEVGI